MYSISDYGAMIADQVRTGAFVRALRARAVTPHSYRAGTSERARGFLRCSHVPSECAVFTPSSRMTRSSWRGKWRWRMAGPIASIFTRRCRPMSPCLSEWT